MENKVIHNVLSSTDVNYILNSTVVKENKKKLQNNQKVNFKINLSNELINKIETALGINLSKTAGSIPMRWIKGDTLAHIDKGEKHFNKTHIIYLNDTIGNLVVDGKHYEIEAGNAHIFSEGLEHHTINTEDTERVMIGPISETGFSVGESGIYFTNSIANGFLYTSTINEITIFNIPPPVPITISGEYVITSTGDEPDWTPPPGKKFGGWILADGVPIGDNPESKIYMPGELYEYNQSNVTFLIPYWINNVRIRLDLNNVEGTTRSEILSGNTLLSTRNNKKNKLSSGDILKIKKARASRSFIK